MIAACITQYTFRLVLQFALNLSLGHLFIDMCDTTKGDQVTKSKKIVKLTYKSTLC